MEKKNIDKTIENLLNNILEKLDITEEKFLYEYLYCVRYFQQVRLNEKKYYSFYDDRKEKKKYPKNKIIESVPSFCGKYKEYAFEVGNKSTMFNIYKEHLDKKDISKEDIHLACCKILKMLYVGLMDGFCYNIINCRGEDRKYTIRVSIRNYIVNNFGKDIGGRKNFTYMDDRLKTLSEFKNLSDLDNHVVSEMLKFFKNKSFFIFVAIPPKEESKATQKAEELKKDIKNFLDNIEDTNIKKGFAKELINYLSTI